MANHTTIEAEAREHAGKGAARADPACKARCPR